MPVVVIGANADCVFRDRSDFWAGGESIGDASSGAGEVGVVDPSEGGMTIGEDIDVGSGRGVSAEGRSMGEGRASSLMRSNSTLRFICRSSALSTSV